MDKRITNLNVVRCEKELERDMQGEKRETDFKESLVKMISHRSAIVEKLLKNHAEILELEKRQKAISCHQQLHRTDIKF